MNCNNNGKTYVNFLTPAPGGTAENASYNLGLTHYTCGNRKMCINSGDGLPIVSNLEVQSLGTPKLIGNGQYCLDVRCVCDFTYQQVKSCGCNCGCPQTEKVIAVVCVPLASSEVPTITANGVLADPVGQYPCSNITNEVSLTVSFTVAASAATNGN